MLLTGPLTGLGLTLGSVLAGTDRLAISCTGGAGLVFALIASPVIFLWLQRAEPSPLLLAITVVSVLVTVVMAAAGALLRTSGALLTE